LRPKGQKLPVNRSKAGERRGKKVIPFFPSHQALRKKIIYTTKCDLNLTASSKKTNQNAR